MPSIRYRQPHKRAINSKSQPSAIYRHGAQLTTDGHNKYWLCKYCHIRGYHDAALFASEQRSSYVNSINQSPQSNQSNRQIPPFNQIKSYISQVEIIDISHVQHVIG
jgi:hypothetical protein